MATISVLDGCNSTVECRVGPFFRQSSRLLLKQWNAHKPIKVYAIAYVEGTLDEPYRRDRPHRTLSCVFAVVRCAAGELTPGRAYKTQRNASSEVPKTYGGTTYSPIGTTDEVGRFACGFSTPNQLKIGVMKGLMKAPSPQQI